MLTSLEHAFNTHIGALNTRVWEQAVEDALSEMLGVPAKLIQPGNRATAGEDPLTISLPLTAITGLGTLLAHRK